MKNLTARLALLSSVPTAVGVLIFPGSVVAQSTACSQTGATITCVDGTTTVLTGTASAGTVTTLGTGLVVTNVVAPSTIVYSGAGPIATTGVRAVSLTSTGGALSFTPAGAAPPVNISTTGGASSNGLTINTAGQAATVTVGNVSTTGTSATGVLVTRGTDLTLRAGDITTTGASSIGLTATGQIGNTFVIAGEISSTSRGLETTASNNGTNTIIVGNVTAGSGAILANGGTVFVTTGNVTTTGGAANIGAFGVTAQAFGGNVTVRTGAVRTGANSSTAITARAFSASGSIDVNGGALITTGNNSNGVFAEASGRNVQVNVGSVTTSGVGSYGVTANTNRAGTVAVDVGVINTNGNGSTGLFARTGTGEIDAGYGNITTSGMAAGSNTANALDLSSTGTINLRGAGATLRTNGAGVTAAVISGAGLTGNLGAVTTTGAGSQGVVIASTAPVNLTFGNVATTGNSLTIGTGVNAVDVTTGDVTASEAGATGTVINSSGAVTFNGQRQSANGADALQINGGAGTINAISGGAATAGGSADGVQIAGTGALTFANTGSIVTAGVNSRGIAISGVTTASVNCGNVATIGDNSPAVVVAANGNNNVGCGTVTTNGAASDAILVTNIAGHTAITGASTMTTGAGSRGIVVNSTGTTATGLVTVNTGTVATNGNAVVATSSAANVVVNATGNVGSSGGTGITATTGGSTIVAIGAGTTTTGVQGVILQGDSSNTLIVNGTLRNAGGSTPYTVFAGGPFTLTLGSAGTIVGPLAFTTGNDTFNNQATFALPATLDFSAASDTFNNTGAVTAVNGTSTISNLETFNNTGGLIDMRDGAANDVVNLSNSNYVATGDARLGIDLATVGGTNTEDRLVIGGATSGATTLLVNFGSPVIDPIGALIVDSTLNNLTAGQFLLAGNTSLGLIDYSAQVEAGDVFLVSTPNERVFDTVFLGRQTRDLWYKSADAYNAYSVERRSSFDRTRNTPVGLWAQLYGASERAGETSRTTTAFGTTLSVSDRIRTRYHGAQAGIEFGTPNFVVGVTGGYERAEGTSKAGSELRTKGNNYGAYVQFGMASGLYVGALIKRDDYRASLVNNAFQGGFARPGSKSTGVEGEAGFRTGDAGTLEFDLGAGLAYVRSIVDTFNFGNISFDQNRMTSLRGRVHTRVTFGGALAPFAEARGFHEFRGDNSFQLRSGSSSTMLDGAAKGTWFRLEGGIGGGAGVGGAMLSGWADFGDARGYGVRVGFRF